MIPVKATPLVDNGIVVFCPKLSNYNRYILKLDIYYSKNKADYSWLKCDTSQKTLWSKRTEVEDNSTLFIYRSDILLKAGFYHLALTAYTNGREIYGSKTIGVLNPTKNLHVGLVYSIYPPIDMV